MTLVADVQGPPVGAAVLVPPRDACNTAPLDAGLRSLEQAIQLLERPSHDEARAILDQAEALRVYAKRAGLALEAQNRCAEIRIRAERHIGELLRDMPRRRRGEYERQTSQSGTFAPSLAELGVSRSQSSRWQMMAAIPEADFERHLAVEKTQGHELRSAAFWRLARQRRGTAGAEASFETAASSIQSLHDLAQSNQQFGCIYADPPWPYENQATRGATGNHYPTMSVDDIAALPIASVSASVSHLHLWTTNAFLFDAERVMASWGFEYKSAFLWVKPTLGLGNYWRCAHEFLLLGVRGRAPFRDRTLRSWISAPRTRHSEKPACVRELLERASPGPYLELFARRQVGGWSSWGNELKTPV